jgi:uncharacterized LabA/DUF88 family protein
MIKVICYVDGFNLYHAIDDLNKPHLKWLDVSRLAQSLCRRGETLARVNYFSAYATWRPASYARHRELVAALKSVGVVCHMARFSQKPAKCNRCGHGWISREEKETDVHFAITFVEDAMDDAFDRAIIVSADGDYIPAIRRVRGRFPQKEIFVAVPPGRFAKAREITKAANGATEITNGRLARCLFARTISEAGSGIARRPVEYDPPQGWTPPQ